MADQSAKEAMGEFTRLLEEEARAAEDMAKEAKYRSEIQKKLLEYMKRQKAAEEDLEKLAREDEKLAKERVASLRRQHAAMDAASKTLTAGIQNITNLFTGRIFEALTGFGQMFIGLTEQGKAKRLAQAEGGISGAPGKGGGRGGSDGAGKGSALLALAGPAGMVAAALLSVASSAKQAYETMQTLARTASPQFASAWDESITYLMAVIGQHFVVPLVHVGAAIVDLADELNGRKDEVRQTLTDGFRNMFDPVGQAGTSIGRILHGNGGVFGPGTMFGPAVDPGTAGGGNKAGDTAAAAKRQEDANRGRQTGLEAFINTMQQRSTPPGGFEDVTAAFKRVQSFDANQSDIQKRTMEITQDLLTQVSGINQSLQQSASRQQPTGAAD